MDAAFSRTTAELAGFTALLVTEREARRKPMRRWRVLSVVGGVIVGVLWPGWGFGAFVFCQLVAYATYRQSVYFMRKTLGLSEREQVTLLSLYDQEHASRSAADRMREIRPK